MLGCKTMVLCEILLNWIFRKCSFLEGVSFHSQMFGATNFGLVPGNCIVIAMILINIYILQNFPEFFFWNSKYLYYYNLGYVEHWIWCLPKIQLFGLSVAFQHEKYCLADFFYLTWAFVLSIQYIQSTNIFQISSLVVLVLYNLQIHMLYVMLMCDTSYVTIQTWFL